jgi:diacylglycerol kinase
VGTFIALWSHYGNAAANHLAQLFTAFKSQQKFACHYVLIAVAVVAIFPAVTFRGILPLPSRYCTPLIMLNYE